MKQFVSYGTAYLLWAVTIAGSLLLAVVMRATYHFALEQTAWDRYSLSAIERFATLFLGMILVVLFIFTEHFYRTAVEKERLWERFIRVSAIGLGIYAAIGSIRVAMEWSVGVFEWISFLLVVVAVTGTALLDWLARWLRQRQRAQTLAMPLPHQHRANPVLAIVYGGMAALGTLWLFRLPLRTPLNVYDEGLALLNGERVLAGEVPFRDFWAIYPPGQSYALAVVFQLFGTNVMSARLYDTVIRMATVLCIFLIADRLISRRAAWAMLILTALLLAAATFYSYAIFPAILFGMLGILALIQFIKEGKQGWLVAGGVAVGITAAYRLDVGFYAGVSLMAGILLFELTRPTRNWQVWLRHSLLLAGGTLLIMVPFYGYLIAASGAAEVWADLIVFPLTLMPEARRLPYPPLWLDLSALTAASSAPAYLLNPVELWLLFYLPLLIYPTALIVLMRRAWTRAHSITDAAMLALVILGIGLFNQALSRYDGIHVLPTSIFALITAIWLLSLVSRAAWSATLGTGGHGGCARGAGLALCPFAAFTPV